MCQLKARLSNNQAEYEALILGLRVLVTMKAKYTQVMGDSQLMMKQLTGEYKCTNPNLIEYYKTTSKLLKQVVDVVIMHIPRKESEEPNELAQHASGYKEIEVILKMEEYPLKECLAIGAASVDAWKENLEKYLKNPSADIDFKVRQRALNFMLVDEELYKRSLNAVLLKFLNRDEALKVMDEVHEGDMRII